MSVKVDWQNFKSFVSDRSLAIQYIDLGNEYWLKSFDAQFSLECFLDKSPTDTTELLDFEINFKSLSNARISEPANTDGRRIIHQTSRKRGLTTYFAGAGDDTTDPHKVGGGAVLRSSHKIGAADGSLYIDFNTINNESYMHEGYLQWRDADNDVITVTTVPIVTASSVGTATDYDLYGGYLVVPAAPGTGTLIVNNADRVLVQVPYGEDGSLKSAGYFDADWNTTTKIFDNIIPNYSGTGAYNMFTVEINLHTFVEQQCLLGSGFMALKTSDTDMFGHGMRVKIVSLTNLEDGDHDWKWNASFTMHRKKTV